jgi:hypothetical protein
MPTPVTPQNPADYGRVRRPYLGEDPQPPAPVRPEPFDFAQDRPVEGQKPAKPAKEG